MLPSRAMCAAGALYHAAYHLPTNRKAKEGYGWRQFNQAKLK